MNWRITELRRLGDEARATSISIILGMTLKMMVSELKRRDDKRVMKPLANKQNHLGESK